MTTSQISLKAKLLLVLFGTVFGVIILIVTFQFIPLRSKGTEFGSIDEIRKAMLSDNAPEAGELDSNQSISLRGIVTPHQNDRIIYTLRPNLDLRFVRANVKTNSCGMRSPERPIAKPLNTYRIALLGDSFAFGWGVEEKETFAHRLEENLNRLTKGSPRVEVLNFGVPGYSTFQEVALFEEMGLDFKPDAVLVYFVQNDFGMPFFIRSIDGSGGILSSLKFVQLGRQLFQPQEMDQKINEMGLDPNHALRDLSKIAQQNGLPVMLVINPRADWQQDLKKLWGIKKDIGIHILNLRDPLMEIISRRKINETDLTLSYDPHPSPLRHAILGDILTPYFISSLNK